MFRIRSDPDPLEWKIYTPLAGLGEGGLRGCREDSPQLLPHRAHPQDYPGHSVLPCSVAGWTSRIQDPDFFSSRTQGQKGSRIRILIKEFTHFDPKNCFKLLEIWYHTKCSSRIQIRNTTSMHSHFVSSLCLSVSPPNHLSVWQLKGIWLFWNWKGIRNCER